MAHSKKDRHEIGTIAAKYDLVFDGKTRKGHYKWLHMPTGRRLTSVSNVASDMRALKNVERAFKQRLRQILPPEVIDNGHDD